MSNRVNFAGLENLISPAVATRPRFVAAVAKREFADFAALFVIRQKAIQASRRQSHTRLSRRRNCGRKEARRLQAERAAQSEISSAESAISLLVLVL